MFRNKPGHILLRFWHYPVVTLGPGRRLGLWLQGCSIHCRGCIAPENQPFDTSFSISIDTLMSGFDSMVNAGLSVTISGGEPFDQAEAMFELLERLNGRGVRDILLYSGYAKGRILSNYPWLSERIAALVDGPFVEGAETFSPWRGSENQTLTIFNDAYRPVYELWSNCTERGMQLVKKDTGRYLIGIPRQGDHWREQLLNIYEE